MTEIDVTMTATRRPELILRTLRSFKEGLFQRKADLTLIVNVDPVGEDIPSEEVVDTILGGHFATGVVYRCPKVASFPDAFRWVWGQTKADFVFHLEDDWELVRAVDLDDMLALMQKHPKLAVLRLPYTCCTSESNKSWNKFLPWNGEFYEVPDLERGLLGFAGHPSLIRKSFVALAYQLLSSDRNPEKSIKWKPLSRLGQQLQLFRYGVYGKPGDGPAVVDIGKGWKEKNGWEKKGNKAHFTVWAQTQKGG